MNFKYPYAISIGSSCVARRFIDMHKLANEYLFFDWIGSSMWAVNKLIENRFTDIDNVKDYVTTVIKSSDQKAIITHDKFYLRFVHDFAPVMHNNGLKLEFEPHKKYLKQTVDKYTRRAQRFLQIVKSSKQLLFVRVEEDQKDRIIYEKYAKEPKDELQELHRFTVLIKALNPELEFAILFFSTTLETKRCEQIFVIGHKKEIDWHNCEKELPCLLAKNKELISDLLKK